VCFCVFLKVKKERPPPPPPFHWIPFAHHLANLSMKTMTSLSMFLIPNLHLCRDVKTPFMLKIHFISILDFEIPSTWHVTFGN